MAKTLPLRQAEAAPSEAPIFERVAIIGYGLIGGSLGLAIRQRWPSSLVIAIDRKPVIETAMQMHAADVGGDDLVLAGDARLVVLAAPVLPNNTVLGQLADYLPGDALITDVGSTKRETLAAARALPPRLRFVGGHPLAGAAVGGLEHARPDLFAGRPWILTPAAPGDEEPLVTFLRQLGARPQTMTPEAHDRLLALLSHLPQVTASALMHVVGNGAGAEGLSLAGRGLRDTTRLAASPAHIWRDIALTNAANLGAALDSLIAVLTAVKDSLGADGRAIDEVFASAADWKRELERERGE